MVHNSDNCLTLYLMKNDDNSWGTEQDHPNDFKEKNTGKRKKKYDRQKLIEECNQQKKEL
jgi:hypothetical protein